MSTMKPLSRIYLIAVTACYPFFCWYFLRRTPREEITFALIGSSLFFVIYLLLPSIFLATIEPADSGVRYHQFSSGSIPYAVVRSCWGVFVFPFQVVIVRSSLRFPRNFFIAVDSVQGHWKSFLQEGVIAHSIRSRLRRDAGKADGPGMTETAR